MASILKDILWAEYGLDVTDLSPLTGGRLNRLSGCGPWVVKVYDETRVPSEQARRAAILQHELALLGFPTPAPLRTKSGQLWTDSPDGIVVVMPLMHGQRRTRGGLSTIETARLGATLGSLHSALKAIKPGILPSSTGKMATPLDRTAAADRWANLKQLALAVQEKAGFDLLVIEMADYVAMRLGRFPEVEWSAQPWQLCHGDMHLDNLLFDELGNVSGIIDFDNAQPGWVGFEVMMAWNLCLFRNPERPAIGSDAAEFFREYQKASGLPSDVIAGFPLLYWLLLVSNTWPATIRYRGSPLMQDWVEILALRFRAAQWLDENLYDVVDWLGSILA